MSTARQFLLRYKVSAHHFAPAYVADMHHELGRSTVLIRVLAERWLPYDQLVARMEDATRALDGLSHPAIITALGMTSIHGRPAMITEYHPAISLKRLLSVCQQDACNIPLRLTLSVARSVASAMGHAHETLALVHQDLSPANIMVGLNGQPTVVNFEGSHSRLSRSYTDALMLGTMNNMAPEIMQGASPHPAADVFSLGITLSTLLTQQTPSRLGSHKKDFAHKLSEQRQLWNARLRDEDVSALTRWALPKLLEQMLSYDATERPDWWTLHDIFNDLCEELDGASAALFCEQYCKEAPPMAVESALQDMVREDPRRH